MEADRHQSAGRAARLPVATAKPAPPAELMEVGRAFLRHHPSVDIHGHPGRFFMRDADPQAPLARHFSPPFPERAIREMNEGQVSLVLFATVADYGILDLNRRGLHACATFPEGEVLRDHHRQMRVLDDLIGNGVVRRARDRLDVAARSAPACMISVEGGDFIEGDLDRLTEARKDGVRAITLLHYTGNALGDVQTDASVHGGLTALGRAVVGEMNRLGIIVDLAHASAATVRDAASTSVRPMMISHSNVAAPDQEHARLIDLNTALHVTRNGGIVGAVPAGFAQTSLDDYIDTIIRMVELLGIDHVAIGTDMDFTYEPVFSTYSDWPLLPAMLLARGLHEGEVAKIMGGNFLRILPDWEACPMSSSAKLG